MLQRQRDEMILNDITNKLIAFQSSRDSSSVLDILHQARVQGLCYDLDTIDYYLDLFHNPKGSAIAVYDDLYPMTAQEAQRISQSRRLMIKRMGIRA